MTDIVKGIRVNDAQRQEIAGILNKAMNENYIALDDWESRIVECNNAITKEQLTVLISDLPEELTAISGVTVNTRLTRLGCCFLGVIIGIVNVLPYIWLGSAWFPISMITVICFLVAIGATTEGDSAEEKKINAKRRANAIR